MRHLNELPQLCPCRFRPATCRKAHLNRVSPLALCSHASRRLGTGHLGRLLDISSTTVDVALPDRRSRCSRAAPGNGGSPRHHCDAPQEPLDGPLASSCDGRGKPCICASGATSRLPGPPGVSWRLYRLPVSLFRTGIQTINFQGIFRQNGCHEKS